MSINETAYDTTACSGYRYNQIVEDLKKTHLMGGLGEISVNLAAYDTQFKLNVLQGGCASADQVAFFKHPVIFKNSNASNDSEQHLVYLDIREFGKFLPNQSQFVVRNGAEYAWAIKRTILNKLWIDGKIDAMRDISTIPVAVYASLLSESIARRFALDPAEQMTVAVLSAYFYYQLFVDVEMSEDEQTRTVGSIVRATKIPAQKVFDVLSDVRSLHTLDDLCAAIRKSVNNVALEHLNVGTLYAVCCGNWFGSNAREVMAVGLEHVPTWLMIVSSSLSSATFKRSTLAKISSRFDKANAGLNLQRSLDLLIGGAEAVDQKEYSTYY